jgi:uncharacterized radical SAM superfamily protein
LFRHKIYFKYVLSECFILKIFKMQILNILATCLNVQIIHPHIILGVSNEDFNIYMLSLLIIVLIYTAAGIFMTIMPYVYLKLNQQKRSQKTYQLQIKLYKSVMLQGWAVVILCAIPICLTMLIYLKRLPGSAIWTPILYLTLSLHGPSDFFIIG